MTRGDQPRGRRGFTLVEMMVAAMMTAFVVGAVSVSLSQLGRAKSSSRTLLSAHLRADSALTALRRDIASVLRDPDLFWTRLLLEDHTAAVAERMRSVAKEMQTEFDVPVLRVNTDDDYEPALDPIIDWIVAQDLLEGDRT